MKKPITFPFSILLFVLWMAPLCSQEDSSQSFVYEKGQIFAFQKKNMVCSNWSLAAMDPKMKLGKESSFYYNDTSQRAETGFRLHFPLLVKPYTEYVLHYSVKVQEMTPPFPSVDLQLLNPNKDILQASQYPLEVTSATKDWVECKVPFTTDKKTNSIRLNINSERQGTAVFWLDNVYLEQVSEPLVWKPASVLVMQKKNVALKKEMDLGTYSLPSGKSSWALQMALKWREYKGSGRLLLDWLGSADDSKPLSQEICQIEPVAGIQSQWDGITLAWSKKAPGMADSLVFQRDRALNQDVLGGMNSFSRTGLIPENAKAVRIHILSEKKDTGNLLMEDLILVAEE
jgi:hypothetical protein